MTSQSAKPTLHPMKSMDSCHQRRTRPAHVVHFVILLISAVVLASCSTTKSPDKGSTPTASAPQSPLVEPIPVKLIALNDFHGHLQAPQSTLRLDGVEKEVGGVDYLAAHIRRLRAAHPYVTIVGAGDLIGASPLISALFHDEPTIEALGLAGLTISSVGNHEFDEGVAELLRIQRGGCHLEDGCQGRQNYPGAPFQYLAANVVDKTSGQTILPPTKIVDYGPVKVGFIGLTLQGTGRIVDPVKNESIRFLDEIEVINTHAQALQAQGVEAIVVLIHEGLVPDNPDNLDGCDAVAGPLMEIVQSSSDAVDVYISGHTHQAYNCTIDEKLVISAKSYGRVISDIVLYIDPQTGDVRQFDAQNELVTRDIEPSSELTRLTTYFAEKSAPLAHQKVGHAPRDILRDFNTSGESELGFLIADAQLAATADPKRGGAVVAFMNPGGIRESLVPARETERGDISYGDLYRVQPFGNTLVTMTLTGAQILNLLESQFLGRDRPTILQPSKGFQYSWDPAQPVGQRIVPDSVTLAGNPVNPAATYRVTVNSYLAGGGDGFSILTTGTDRKGGPVDLDALSKYIQQHSPVTPPALGRIKRVP